MQNYFIVSFALLLAACTPTRTASPPIPKPDFTSTAVSDAATLSQTQIMSGAAVPTVTVNAGPTGSLLLQVISPTNDSVVNMPQVDVIGTAPAGAVLSVNDEIAIVGENGQFQITVALDEGLNLIEVVASDDQGVESSLLLTITYEP